jgi:hypothetical protein
MMMMIIILSMNLLDRAILFQRKQIFTYLLRLLYFYSIFEEINEHIYNILNAIVMFYLKHAFFS